MRNDSGPRLNADSLQVDQGMSLTVGFTATGDGEDHNWTVALTGAAGH